MEENRWKIKVSDLLTGEVGKKAELEREVKLSESFEDFNFSPLLFEIEIQNADLGIILGKFKISGKIAGSCFRCLKKIEKDFRFEFNANFCKQKREDCDSLIKNSELNFKDIFIQELEARLPVKFLCKDSCKGLCEICGGDLNVKKCKCNISKKVKE